MFEVGYGIYESVDEECEPLPATVCGVKAMTVEKTGTVSLVVEFELAEDRRNGRKIVAALESGRDGAKMD